MEMMSKTRLLFILLEFIILALMVATSCTKATEEAVTVFSTNNFEMQNLRKRAGSEHLLINCVIFCWWICRFHVNVKSAANLRQLDRVYSDGKNYSWSKPWTSIVDILETDICPKSSTSYAYKKRDLYSNLFSFRQNAKQKGWVLPASLHQYFHALENTSDKCEVMKFEWARYETFKTFPKDSPAMPIRLAANGFYYNGVGDTVTCFSCGLQYRGWKDTDTVSDIHARLRPNCNFLKGLDHTNISIHSDEVQGAPGGTYYESNNSCSSGEVFIRRQCHQSKENESTARRQPNKYPDYESYQHRMDTFTDWPYPEIIEPCVLADAGFFFAGFGDCVRCFSCGGGLRNWVYGDGPWGEHARWFPRCTFLRERKGPDFIRQHLDEDTDWVDEQAASAAATVLEQQTVNGSEKCENENNSDKYVVERTNDNESKSKTKKFSVERMLCDMGFTDADIHNICERRGLLEIKDINDTTVSMLLDDLLVKSEASAKNTREEQVRSAIKKHKESTCYKTNELLTQAKGEQLVNSPADTALDPKTLQEENLKLKDHLTCKICMEKDSDVVFIPCGHMVSCEACALNIRKCAICRQPIKGRVKAFMG